MHTRHLLGELGVQGDLPVIATVILAPLHARILEQQIEIDGLDLDRIHAGWSDAVRRIVASQPL
jgi:hypothetical protein